MARKLIGLAVVLLLFAVTGCSSDDAEQSSDTSTSAPSTPTTGSPVVVTGRAVIRGEGTLDGAPFDSRWVGAVVVKDGLVTPCQVSLPPVTKGRYSVNVYAESDSSGCGAPGSEVVLWIFAKDKILFSTEAVRWPGDGQSTVFAPSYSAADSAGAAPVTAQFNGAVFRRDGTAMPSGTLVEAYVNNARCGVASVRTSPGFTGYILAVVGPDAILGCTRGAPLSFRIDGKPAAKTPAVNTPPGIERDLDLTIA